MTTATVTHDHLVAALAVCRAGGTEDHPYEQSGWGNNQCGTPYGIYEHACLIAGVPVGKPTSPVSGWWNVACRQVSSENALQVADLAASTPLTEQTDPALVQALTDAGWSDDRIVWVLDIAGWSYKRIVWAFTVAGWSNDRIVRALRK